MPLKGPVVTEKENTGKEKWQEVGLAVSQEVCERGAAEKDRGAGVGDGSQDIRLDT
jgi:hypothetical protein